MSYDVIVIGGGPGGYQAAIEAAAGGYFVALAEKGNLGGVCLHEGCIPAKTFLYSARLFERMREAETYGLYTGETALLMSGILERKERIVSTLYKGLEARLQKHQIEILRSAARIESLDGRIRIALDNGTRISGRNLIIASGSCPFFPDIPGLTDAFADGFALDGSGFLRGAETGRKVVIIGSGMVGIEFAGFLADTGTEVTLLDSRSEILGELDDDVRKIFLRSLMSKGIRIRLGVDVLEVDARERGIRIRDGGEEEIQCDKVVVCTGRMPCTGGLGAAEAGIAMENGRILTDDYCRTNREHVYAVGDVNGRVMLAHTAYAEAKAAVGHMMGKPQKVEYPLIPRVIYSNPEAAWTGVREKDLNPDGKEYVGCSCSMRYSGKFLIENEREQGICKLVWEKATGCLKGCFLVGDGASELIITAENMIRDKKTAEDIKHMVFPHPSVGEVLQECAYMA